MRFTFVLILFLHNHFLSAQNLFQRDTISYSRDSTGVFSIPNVGAYWLPDTIFFTDSAGYEIAEKMILKRQLKYRGQSYFIFYPDGYFMFESCFIPCGKYACGFEGNYVLDGDTIKFNDSLSYLPSFLLADFQLRQNGDSVLELNLIRSKIPDYSYLFRNQYVPVYDSLQEQYRDAIDRNIFVEMEWNHQPDSTWICMWGTDTLLRVENSVNTSTKIYYHNYLNDLSELFRADRLSSLDNIQINTPFRIFGAGNRFIFECIITDCKAQECEAFYLLF